MSVEAFLWNYRAGNAIGFDFSVVRGILDTGDSAWNGENGCLGVRFRNPDDAVDIYLGREARESNHVAGITVSRPIAHSDYLQRVFRVMELGNVMHFYSDEPTPTFICGTDPRHYPAELLAQLGEPRFIRSPTELLHRT